MSASYHDGHDVSSRLSLVRLVFSCLCSRRTGTSTSIRTTEGGKEGCVTAKTDRWN